MNHIGVTLDCGRCERPSVVIIAGAHYCSPHGLDATMQRVAATTMIVDLRSHGGPVIDLDPAPSAVLTHLDALAS